MIICPFPKGTTWGLCKTIKDGRPVYTAWCVSPLEPPPVTYFTADEPHEAAEKARDAWWERHR